MIPSESEKPGNTLRDAFERFRDATVGFIDEEAGWPAGQVPMVVELEDIIWVLCSVTKVGAIGLRLTPCYGNRLCIKMDKSAGCG